MSALIVLFGQANDWAGKLEFPATARCARAAELYKERSPGEEIVILPTGGFGPDFNRSEYPHFHYLARELERLEVPPENILPGVSGSSLLEDCTEAWYRFKNSGMNRLVAVTSDYQADRVAFILGRLSANDDAEIEIVTADTPSAYPGRDKQLEPQILDSLRREWVNVIPRGANVPPERLVSVYSATTAEHRHYDTLSTTILFALLAVNAFAFVVVPGHTLWIVIVLLIILAAIELLLWTIFKRWSDDARTARRVAARMEIEHRMPGFASNLHPPRTVEWYRSPPWLWSMKELLAALATLLFIAVAVLSFAAADLWESRPVRTTYPAVNTSASPAPANATANGNGNAVDRFVNAVTGSQENSNANTNRRRR
jgi:hypothetical protein